MKLGGIRSQLRSTEQAIYTWLTILLAYSLVCWTLGNTILSIALSAFWLFISAKQFNLSTQKSRVLILFLMLYFLLFCSFFYTSNRKEGISDLIQKLALIIYPMVFGTTDHFDPPALKKIFRHFVIATAIASVLGLIKAGYLVGFVPVHSFAGKDVVFFHLTYPYSMGLFCLLSISFVCFGNDIIPKRRARFSLFTLFSSIIFLLSVRLIVILWMPLLVFFIAGEFSVARQRIWIAVAMIATIIVASITIVPLRSQWREVLETGSQENNIQLDKDVSLGRSWGGKAIRIAIWQCCEDVLHEHWIGGVGLGDVQDTLQSAYEKRQFYFASRYNRYNAHNQYLQLWIATGIAGLLVFMANLVVPFCVCRSSYYARRYFIFLLLFAIICFSEVILNTNKGIVWYSFFNSIFAFNCLNRMAAKQTET